MTLKQTAVIRCMRYVLLFAASMLLAGAARPPATKPWLLHLNGIGGERMCDHALIEGLAQGGFKADVEFYDWTGGQIGIEALQGRERHETEARKIADKLAGQFRAHPKTPIYMTSHSGGCGVAVWALELLPDEVKVDYLLLFAPALSPDYNLTKALRHVNKKAYVFSSEYDQIVLGTGTKLFGTIDGQRVEAAGLNGFVEPDTADAEQYKKLIAQPYKLNWLREYGSAGSHISALGARFSRGYVATLLLTGSPPKDKEVDVAATTQPARPVGPLP